MKIGPAHAALLERFVVAVERIADALDAPARAKPTTLPDLLKSPEPKVPPPIAGYEICECDHEQLWHAAGKGPCQRCIGVDACQRFRGTGRYTKEEAASTPIKPLRLTKVTNGEWRPGKCEREILRVLSERHPRATPIRQLAVMAKYSRDGGSFGNAIGALRTHGLVSGKRDELMITANGLVLSPKHAPLTGQALLDRWGPWLGACERSILEFLRSTYPKAWTREELAEATDYEPTGGSFGNALGRIRTLELAEGYEEIRATKAAAS